MSYSSLVYGIEILSTDYLQTNRNSVESFIRLSKELEIELGWHYLLDLTWAAKNLTVQKGRTVLDAGAGCGLMQWWISEQGMDVLSVDRQDRLELPLVFRENFPIYGFPDEMWSPLPSVGIHNFCPSPNPARWIRYPEKLRNTFRLLKAKRNKFEGKGKVYFYDHDLKDLVSVEDNSIDDVISISALEHNSPQELKLCVRELLRVLKPNGKLIVTLSASKNEDWFHEPSAGWCYTENTIREIFDIPSNAPSNYAQFDDLFAKLKNCAELRHNLAPFYFQSGNNGMPWGVWDPQYLPVGVIKTKATC